MNEDTHLDGQNEEAGFEREDLAAKPILIFLIVLTVICVLVALLLRGMYSHMDARENRNQPDQSPLVQQTTADTRVVGPGEITKFPQPRLESNETTEINAFRLQEEQTLNSYGWVDQQAGVVRIPINRAMELMAQRGLPTRSQAGVAADGGKAKAVRPDTSRQATNHK